MTSYQDNIPFIPSSPKLPAISTGGLVTGPDSYIFKRPKVEWAGALRRQIDHAIHVSGRAHAEDIAQLHRELVKLIITVLQPNSSREVWLDLNSALGEVGPYINLLASSHGRVGLAFQTQHYVERLYVLYQAEIAKYFDIPIVESMRNVFPNEVASAEAKFGQINAAASPSPDFMISGGNYFTKSPGTAKSSRPKTVNITTDGTAAGLDDPISSMKRSITMDLPDGRHPYTLVRRGDEPELYFRPRPLTFGDFSQSISAVAMETAAKESAWKESQSSTVAALAVDLEPPPSTAPPDPKKWVPISTSAIDDFQGESAPASPRKAHTEFKSITGREAVELFMAGRHLNQVKFMYFNLADSRYYRPYDLVSVTQDKVEAEHYIFSSFGVLHVYRDGSTSECMSLAEWNRKAVLWSVISQLGYFKNFLICRTFKHWRNIVRRQRLIRMRTYLRLNLLHAVPEFGAALLHVFRLVGELEELQMLPNEKSLRQFTLLDFDSEVAKKKTDVDHMIEVFFRYCKKVVDVTRQECFDQLKHYEYQARHSRSLFSKESLYIQRKKRQVRMMNLQSARQAIRHLSTFMTLVDQVISVHLLEVLRNSVRRFVTLVLCSFENQEFEDDVPVNEETHSTATSPSKGFHSTYSTKGDSTTKTSEKMEILGSVFVTKLIFNSKTCELEMQPSIAKFKESVCSSISNIISTVCDRAYSMNISGKPTQNDVPGRPGSVSSSMDSAQTSSSERSSVASLSSELDGQNDYEDAGPDDVEAADGQDGFGEPEIPSKKMPSKEEDDMGVATPNLVVSPEPGTRFGLMVDGSGIMGQFNPLDQAKLRNKLINDIEIQESIQMQNDVVECALKEVEHFCDEHNQWLVPIRKFACGWSKSILKDWKGKPAREIEKLLTQMKSWSDQVKNLDRSLLSRNRLLLVDCRAPQNEIVPALASIFKQLISLVAGDAKALSLEITTNSKEAVKILENKDLNMRSFAAYARKVTECQRMKLKMAEKVTYIRQLYEVMRMTHRQLTHEEEKLDEKVKAAWEAFNFQLKDAANFVSNQQPVILKQLDGLFEEKYAYIVRLSQHASSGAMIDPSKNPSEVILELKDLIAKFYTCRKELSDLSECRDSVIGVRFELGLLDGMAKSMEDRLELWKYVNVSSNTIKDWRNTLFKRFNVQNAFDKIVEWQKAAYKLQKNLSEDDPVLINWLKTLNDYVCELPLLKRLADEAIKPRHWKQIFTVMGENYEPGWTFTVNDLLSYKLSDHSTIVNQVYHSAMAEYTLEQMLRRIKNKWESRQFQLAKHIQIIKTTVQEPPSAKANIHPPGSRIRESKPSSIIITKVVTQEKDSDTYVLVGSNELLNELSDSHVSLQGMLQSRHAAEVRSEAEIWSDTLQQIGEIVNLWTSCQDKWMYLNRVFSGDPYLAQRFPAQNLQFDKVDRKYREFIQAMINDPKVLSVLSRRHGQKGWRELQGENLRRHILSCISMEEELLSNISLLLEEFRSEFPRMYFLCDEDCIKLLAVSRQPRKLLPYVCKCFRGVKSLTYRLPTLDSFQEAGLAVNALDLELHSHELQVTHMQGKNGENIEFETPLTTQSESTTWMKIFEEKMRHSISTLLLEIIRQRAYGTPQSPMEALEELTKNSLIINSEREEVSVESMENEKMSKFKHWLLRYPGQVILLSDSLFWTQDMKNLLKNEGKKENYDELKKKISHNIKQFGHVIRDNMKGSQKNAVRGRLQATLAACTAQAIYHRDVLQNLEREKISSINSFDWQKIIRHAMQIPNSELEFEVKSRYGKDFKCQIEHLGEQVAAYGLEYDSCLTDRTNGSHPGTPVVLTPLAERSMFSLCLALQLGKCGTLIGPEATGKSSVISQLARVFGRPLINLNCSEGISIPVLFRALCGMVESGSWLCLDQVHRLPNSMISVLAQQIRHIQLAYSLLHSSTTTQYSVRGQAKSENITTLKRSHSITNLHHLTDSTEENDGSSDWQPRVNQYHMSRMCRNKEDTDMPRSTRPQYEPQAIGSILFNGRLLQAKPNYGIFMMMTSGLSAPPSLPHNLKLVYRPIAMIKPDTQKIIEVWLQASGFSNSSTLAEKLSLAMEMLNGITDNINMMPYKTNPATGSVTEAGEFKIAHVTLSNIRTIIAVASENSANSRSQIHSRAESVVSYGSSRSSISGSTTSSTGRRAGSSNSETMMTQHNEELSIVNALLIVMSSKLNSASAVSKLKDSLRTVFPLATRPISASEQDQVLPEGISQQMQIDGLQTTPEIVEKTTQLQSALKLNRAVILVGPAGAGKTTMYRTLARTLNKLYTDSKKKSVSFIRQSSSREVADPIQTQSSGDLLPSTASEFPSSPAMLQDGSQVTLFGSDELEKIDMTVLFPNTLTTEDLFGSFDPATNVWHQGMLAKILKDCNMVRDAETVANIPQKVQSLNDAILMMKTEISERIRKWIIMDGEINSPWIENMSCLLDTHKSTRLSNLDDLTLPDSANILFEVTDFASASPSMVSRCALVHCDGLDRWHLMVTTWLDGAYGEYAITKRTVQVWRDLIDDLVPPILEFLQRLGQDITNYGLTYEEKSHQTSCYGMNESTSFLRILGALLDLHLRRESNPRGEYEESEAERTDIFDQPRSRLTSMTADTDAQSILTYASSNRSRLDDNVPDFNHQLAVNLFGFAFVWAFGGQLLEKDMQEFDAFFRKILRNSRYEIPFPVYESVFEYYVQEDSGQFTVWEDKIDLRPRAPPTGSYYALVHRIERYAYLTSLLLKSQHPVLIMGEAGCGKTSMVSNILDEHEMTRITLSPGLTSQSLQKLFESRSSSLLKQHNLGLMAHPNAVIDTRSEGKHSVLFFLDDLSCAAAIPGCKNSSAIQPTHELIRQVMSVGGVYERDRQIMKTLEAEINFLAAATVPGNTGSGHGVTSHPISPRMMRLFTVLHFLQPSKETILSIYHNAVQSWLEEFPAYSLSRHYDLSQAIIAGSMELYSMIRLHLKPTPAQPHYVFSMHDVAHVMQGLFLLTPKTRGRPRPMRRRGMRDDGGTQLQRPAGGRPGGGRAGGRFRRGYGETSMGGIAPMMRTVIRVWLHECSRTYFDRLTNAEDQHWFSRSLQTVLKKHFCTAKDERPGSPAIERVRIVKTPIPSGAGTPLPSRTSTSTLTTSTDNDGTLTISDEASGHEDCKNEPYEDEKSPESGDTDIQVDRSSSTSDAGLQGPVPGKLTHQAITDLHKQEDWDDMVAVSHGSSIETSSRMPPNIAISPQGSFGASVHDTIPEEEEESSSQGESENDLTSEDADLVVSSTTSVKEKSSSGSAISTSVEGSVSVVEGGKSAMSGTSSETLTAAEDNGTEFDSRPTTELKSEDYGDESRSLTTAMTTELETDTSETSSEESDELETTTTDTPSSKSKSAQSKDVKFSSTGGAPEPSAGVDTGPKPPRPPPARPGGAKHGVTFVPGLIDDPDREIDTAGPLAQFNQILIPNEEPTSIIFSKNILSAVEGGVDGYSESTEGQLASALQVAQSAYNDASEIPLDLVFFKQAVQHAARLSRAISMGQNGHVLALSSTRFAGRRSLARLVSSLCKAKLFEAGDVELQQNKRKQLKKAMFDASKNAGLVNEPTILLVDESFVSEEGCIDDLCAVIKDGQCPSLYTHDELVTVAAEILPGAVANTLTTDPHQRSGSTIEKLDRSLEAYFSKVVANLHVVLLMPYPALQGPHDLSELYKNSNSSYFHHKKELETFHDVLRRCPDLLTRFSCIDLYKPWDHSAWVRVGENYLKEFTGVSSEYGTPDVKIPIPWPSDISAEHQVVNLSNLMAHIHLDSYQRIQASVPRHADEMITPLTFRMMAELFVNIAIKIGRDERKLLRRYEKVLKKVRDAEACLERYGNGRETLVPRLDNARDTERAWKRHVEQERREWAEARQRCELEEEIIEKLEEELVYLREDSRMAFDEVHPMYNGACAAMRNLSAHSLDELKSYKKPPVAAVVVIKALCDMFEVKPASWENGKGLIMQESFFEELEFYDKEHMPEHIYVILGRHVKDPEFKPEQVAKGSRAAESLCSWMHAVYSYAKLSRYLAPKIARLKDAEHKMKRAQATLGAKRVRCNQIKEELDSKIQQHKDAMRIVRQIEKDLKGVEIKIAKAQTLMGNLAEYVTKWRQERDATLSRMESAVGDSLLTAACVTYHGVMAQEQRDASLEEWIKACLLGQIDEERSTFSIALRPSAANKSGDSRKAISHASPGLPRSAPQSAATSIYSKTGTDTLTWDDVDGRSSSISTINRPLALVRLNFEPTTLLVSESSRRAWDQSSLPRDNRTRSNVVALLASAMFQFTSWPLIFDPDDQLRSWMKPIVKTLHRLKIEEEVAAAEEEKESPFPSSGEPSRSDEMSLDIYDDEDSMEDSSQYDDYGSSYFDDEGSTVISITSTSQTLRSGETSRKQQSTTRSSRKSKGVRFAEDKQSEEVQNSTNAKKEVGAEKPPPVEEKKMDVDPGRKTADYIDKSSLNIVICDADSSSFLDTLEYAVISGGTLLVTHLERAPFPVLHDLLLLRNRLRYQEESLSSSLGKSPSTLMSSLRTEGRRHIKLSSHHTSYHLSVSNKFKLFLSVGTDLSFVGGSGVPQLPLSRCGCLNFALDGIGLEEKLVQIVMTQERPEFESHRKMLEADMFHLEEQMEYLEKNLLLKVSNIQGAILSDATLLDAIRSCKRETIGTGGSLFETKLMESNLLQKKVDFQLVAHQGGVIYNALLQTSVLKPNLYYWTASKFIKVFSAALQSRVRGKTSANSNANAGPGSSLLRSRVSELNQSVLEAIMEKVKLTMYQTDIQVFTTFVSLERLAAENKMSRDEIKTLLLGVQENKDTSVGTKPKIFSAAKLKPSWIQDEVWEDAKLLEQKHHSTFAGLLSSISAKQKRWHEYLNSSPILITNVPSDKLLHLSVGQKALLWKTLRPDIGGTIMCDLGASVLGSTTSTTHVLKIEDVLLNIKQQSPIIFLVPEKGTNYQPTLEISNQAKNKKIIMIERAAPFTNDLSDVLLECMMEGYWLVLHNCEHAKYWPDNFLALLYSLTRPTEEERPSRFEKIPGLGSYSVGDEVTLRSISTTTTEDDDLDSERLSKQSESISMEEIVTHRGPVHPNFRLWLVTKSGSEFHFNSFLPGVLLQYGEIINLELTPNHRDTLKQKFTHLSTEEPLPLVPINLQVRPLKLEPPLTKKKKKAISTLGHQLKLKLSLLDAILQQRLPYEDSNFIINNDEDVLDIFRCCQPLIHTGNEQSILQICKAMMCEFTLNYRNQQILKFFIEECLVLNEGLFGINYRSRNRDIVEDLQTILGAVKIDQGFNELLPQADLRKLSLPVGADKPHLKEKSKRFLDRIKSVTMYGLDRVGLIEKPFSDRIFLVSSAELFLKRKLENLHMQIQVLEPPKLQNSDDSPPPIGPMADFFKAEFARVTTAISLLQHDIFMCISSLKGQLETNPTILEMLECVYSDSLPQSWTSSHPEIFRFYLATSLTTWIEHLKCSGKLLMKYAQTSVISSSTEVSKYGAETEQTPLKRCSSATQTPSRINLGVFLRPDMFLKSVLAEAAKSKFQDAQKYRFKVEITSKLYAKSVNKMGNLVSDFITLEGIWLEHAVYDERYQTILESTTEKIHHLPPIRLIAEKKPRSSRKNETLLQEDKFFQCPVFLKTSKGNSDSDILLHIPIKCDVDPDLLTAKSVQAQTYLPNV